MELAVAIARKLAPELVSREPFAEIAALATECFKQLAAAPHVVVRVNDALHETARAQLDEIARTRGFEGRLVVVAEPEIALGDCKIEWADGGVVRDAAKTDTRHRQRHRTLPRRAADRRDAGAWRHRAESRRS